MKRPLAVIGLLLALAFPAHAALTGSSGGSHHSSSSSSEKKVYVKGYYRKDGTYVPPHYRAAPGTGQSTASAKPPSTTTSKPASSTVPWTPASGTTSTHPRGCQTCPRDANGRIL